MIPVQVRVSSNREPEPLALDAFERLGDFVLRHEEVPESSELSIALVSEDEMANLNERYRSIAASTDVLSFPCDDPCPTGGDEPITLGDVIIAPEVAERRALVEGATVERELNTLLIHGVLHLLGYDHDTDEGAEAMQQRETALLTAWEELA